jgi:hypothetical protein
MEPSSSQPAGAPPRPYKPPAKARYVPTAEELAFAKRVAELPAHLFKKGELGGWS